MKRIQQLISLLATRWRQLQQPEWAKKYPRTSRAAVLLTLIFILLLLTHSAIGWNRTAAFQPLQWLEASAAYKAVIRRDNLGVPSVQGDKDTDVAFGIAYAHATDALEDLEYMLRLNTARMGLEQGTAGVLSDWLVHLLRSHEIAEKHWEDVPESVRTVLSAYADGLNYYAYRHPDRVDQTLYPIIGKDLLAGMHFQQLMFYGFADILKKASEGQIAELSLPPSEGSNAIAIAPGRGWGATQLLINSHQPLDGPLSWYEMRLDSKEGWEIHGGGFLGSPFVYLGVTANLGWGATVNKPGLVRFYRLKLHQDNPRRYFYNGSWWDMEVREVNLPYKLFGNFYWSATRELEYTKHGPVLRTEKGTWAMNYAGAEEYRQAEQWLRMNKAQDRDEWMEAMRIRAIPSLNFVYADAQGYISYIYNALLRLVPPEALDEDGALPGDSSQWLDLPLLPFDKLPALHNPRSGWVVSVNQTPFYATNAQYNLRYQDFPESLPIETIVNNRALRAVELLGRAGPVTPDRLVEIKFDKTYSNRYPYLDWLEDLRDENFEAGSRLIEDVQRELLLWNKTANADNPHAALGVCMVEASRRSEKEQTTFRLKQEMENCGKPLLKHFDTLTPPWGEVLRLRRGSSSWPLGGAPDLLRAIHYRPEEDGTLTAVAGDGLTLLAEWNRNGELSLRTIHQYGSSRNPESLGYDNQAQMFSEEKFRDPYLFNAPAPPYETQRVPE